MRFAEALYNLLGNDSEIVDMLNDETEGLKIFPIVIPQQTIYPAVAFGEKSCDYIRCSPTIQNSIKQTTHIVQINTFAETYQETLDIHQQLVATLDGFNGTINDVGVVSIYILDQKEGFDNDLNLFIKISEYQIKIKT